MGYYDFPHTRNYDTDLGYLIKRYFELSTDFESLEKNFNDLKAWCIAQLNSEALKTLVANKLDEWLEDGTLAALINNPLNHVTTYDTIVEMLTHSALLEGSKIYCAGADTINDGNGGHFRIRARLSTDVIDNYNLYLIDGSVKVAERIHNIKTYITPEEFGAIGDGKTDDTEALQLAINKSYEEKIPLVLSKTYGISNGLITKNGYSIFGYFAEIKALSTIDTMLTLNGFGHVESLKADIANLTGLKINGNYLANTGIKINSGREQLVNECSICNINGIGINAIGGNIAVNNTSLYQQYTKQADLPTNSIGIKTIGDNQFTDLTVVDFATGIHCTGTGAAFKDVRVWLSQDAFIENSVAYKCDENTANYFTDCSADSYFIGFNLANYAKIYCTNIEWDLPSYIFTTQSGMTLFNAKDSIAVIRCYGLFGLCSNFNCKMVSDNLYNNGIQYPNIKNKNVQITGYNVNGDSNLSNIILNDYPSSIPSIIDTSTGCTIEEHLQAVNNHITGYIVINKNISSWESVSITLSNVPIYSLRLLGSTSSNGYDVVTACLVIISKQGQVTISSPDNANNYIILPIDYYCQSF